MDNLKRIVISRSAKRKITSEINVKAGTYTEQVVYHHLRNGKVIQSETCHEKLSISKKY